MEALQNESVAQVRRALNEILRARESISLVGSTLQSQRFEGLEFAMLLQHELSPPIGWARKAGSREINEFARSKTNDALVRLERRIDALVSLLRSESALSIEPIDIGETLQASWPDYENPPLFEVPKGEPLVALTDVRMLELILANIFQNAIDASADAVDPPPISVAWGRAGANFWMRVMNAFVGKDFAYDEVSPTGVTTKPKHQGIGLTLVESACRRLSYDAALAGRSGIATFSITGPVEH